MHPCAQCALLQKTCCERAEVVITAGDAARIARHSGRTDFWEYLAPVEPAYVAADPDDPNWLRWTVRPDGTRRVLRRHPGGACTFLGQSGCTLPGDVRPLVCRLYPFSYRESGITGLGAEYCPTAHVVPPGMDMARMLGMTAENAEGERRQLYRELREEWESP